MRRLFIRCMLALATLLVLSCGGGGGGGGGGTLVGGSSVIDPAGASVWSGRSGVDAGNAGDATGSGSGGASSDGGSSATAANGNGDSGVGSGGTGVSTADASSVGGVDGIGSIFVNGLRYDTDAAVFNIADAPALELGMTAKVTGPVNADFTAGTAVRVESAAELHGTASSIDAGSGTFVVMGTTVLTDTATVWANAFSLAQIVPGATLQIWGLPAAPGMLLATRIEQRFPAASIVTGTVQNLNPAARYFTLGGLTISYTSAQFAGSVDAGALVNGAVVRVRATSSPVGGLLQASSVRTWYAVSELNGASYRSAGIVTDYAGLGSLRVLGIRIDASGAQVSGGPASAISNGVKVEIDGVWSNGVVRASKLRIKRAPGVSESSSFTLIGPVGAFSSASDFKVKGQRVDASVPGVTFVNGTVADLRNGTKVTVMGAQVVNGAVIATQVTFN